MVGVNSKCENAFYHDLSRVEAEGGWTRKSRAFRSVSFFVLVRHMGRSRRTQLVELIKINPCGSWVLGVDSLRIDFGVNCSKMNFPTPY